MKFAMSNIAWAPEDRLQAYAVLQEHGVKGLEIAPSLMFFDAKDPLAPEEQHVARALDELRGFNLSLVSMQSTLFGLPEAQLLGSPRARGMFHEAMAKSLKLAGRLGIGNIVFGSPKNRIRPPEMTTEQAIEGAVNRLRAFGDLAAANATCVGVECNPAPYGGNFLTDLTETACVTRLVAHEGVKMTLDLGALYMLDLTPKVEEIVGAHIDVIHHVHISTPFLEPAPQNDAVTQRLLSSLRRAQYEGWVSIEMKQTKSDTINAVRHALETLLQAARLSTRIET